MSLASSAFDARGLAVIIALTAFATFEHARETAPETQKLVATERDPEPAQPTTADPELSSPDGGSRSHPRYALPGDGSREIRDYRPSLVLQVRRDGSVRVAGKPLVDLEVDNLFHATYAHDKDTQILIKAHPSVAHARVVDLLERAKQSGLMRFAIGTSDGTRD